ncbi:MAG TPA: hypothetical protein VGE07_21220 [Herpetosiphonaceae bacterium]
MTLHSMSRFDTASDCFKHCGNPVIGECGGYREPCGQLYCAVHSQNGLCASCVAAFFREKTLLYRQWASGSARRVPLIWAGLATLALAGCTFFNLAFFVRRMYPGAELIGWVANAAVVLIWAVVAWRLYRWFQESAERFQGQQEHDPGFAGFREQWRPGQSWDESEALVKRLLAPAPAAR